MDKLTALYQQFDPAKPLEANQHNLYVDWQRTLGPDNLKELLARGIARSGDMLCTRLFTGHRGVGKTTELKRVKELLETGEPRFFVSMLEAEKWMDLQDVRPPDIVYQIVRQIVYDLGEAGFSFATLEFGQFFTEIWEQLNRPIEFKDLKVKVPAGMEIGIALKEVPLVRAQIRDLLQQRLPTIYDLINDVILVQARSWLKDERGIEDIAVIVDELDRIPQKDIRPGFTNHEDIFLNNAGTLRFLECDVLYTVPIELAYSRCREKLQRAYTREILTLPVIPAACRDGSDSQDGLRTLCDIVYRRVDEAGVARTGFFADHTLLQRLCRVSGGHVRNLFILICSVMDRCHALPLDQNAVERTIRAHASGLLLPLGAREKEALRKVHATKQPLDDLGETWYGLLRDLFAFAYRDTEGEWYDWNPLLGEVL